MYLMHPSSEFEYIFSLRSYQHIDIVDREEASIPSTRSFVPVVIHLFHHDRHIPSPQAQLLWTSLTHTPQHKSSHLSGVFILSDLQVMF